MRESPNVHHRLEDAENDDAAVVNDDDGDGETAAGEGYYNSTYDKYKQKTEEQLKRNFFSSPSTWSTVDWVIFGIAMTMFGILFTCTCFAILIPICCPGSVKAYARMI
jgi:hypothetical protein